jgi:hypothetical protein
VADFDTDLLRELAEQLMSEGEVSLDGKKLKVERVGRKRLRMVRFAMDGREYQAIEQNPEKPSVWGKLARKGHKVVQFRDLASNKYVAVAVDGKVKTYGR